MEYLTIIRISILMMFTVFLIVMAISYFSYRVKRNKLHPIHAIPVTIDHQIEYRKNHKADTVQEVVFPSSGKVSAAPAREYKPANHHTLNGAGQKKVKFYVVNQTKKVA